MKIVVIASLVASLAFAGCAIKAPVTTPVLPPTSQALLVTALGALQTAAIALAPIDGIPAADTATIIAIVGVAVTTIEASQTGWVSAVDVLINKLPGVLSASTAATLAPYLDAIQAVITSLYGQGVA